MLLVLPRSVGLSRGGDHSSYRTTAVLLLRGLKASASRVHRGRRGRHAGRLGTRGGGKALLAHQSGRSAATHRARAAAAAGRAAPLRNPHWILYIQNGIWISHRTLDSIIWVPRAPARPPRIRALCTSYSHEAKTMDTASHPNLSGIHFYTSKYIIVFKCRSKGYILTRLMR